MAQLTQLKRKIQSIQTTKKITHAIRLVSMSSYSKLEKQTQFLNSYKKNIQQTFAQLLKTKTEWTNKTLFPSDIYDSTPLVIIISSTKGLCGSFNSNLLRYLNRKLLFESNQKPEFIAIGKKAIKEIKSQNLGKIVSSFTEFNYNNIEIISKDIIDKIYNKKDRYSSVYFYSNKFINFFIQRPQKTTLIPADSDFELKEEKNDFDPIFEQEQATILNFMAQKYLKSSILEVLFQSLISENASRFLAMDSSNNNAKKMLQKLILEFNKTRQTLITKEVCELASTIE